MPEKNIMVQATTTRKIGRRFKFLDGLFGSQEDGTELRKDIAFLVQNYIAFNNLAASLSSHSKSIPYQFLIERTKKVADELRNFAEILRTKIIELGGQISQDTLKSSATQGGTGNNASGLRNQNGNDLSKQNIKRLVNDMEEHSSRCDALQHQRNLINDDGIAKLIGLIIIDMQRQKAELLDIVMRIS